MVFASNDCANYHLIKTPIGFWCGRGLNPKSLIQSSKTLKVELIENHYFFTLNVCMVQ